MSSLWICPLSLHDALPISVARRARRSSAPAPAESLSRGDGHDETAGPSTARTGSRPLGSHGEHGARPATARSEEHTSELQSRENLVCRLLLQNKNTKFKYS